MKCSIAFLYIICKRRGNGKEVKGLGTVEEWVSGEEGQKTHASGNPSQCLS